SVNNHCFHIVFLLLFFANSIITRVSSCINNKRLNVGASWKDYILFRGSPSSRCMYLMYYHQASIRIGISAFPFSSPIYPRPSLHQSSTSSYSLIGSSLVELGFQR